jgi:hypothetical protein
MKRAALPRSQGLSPRALKLGAVAGHLWGRRSKFNATAAVHNGIQYHSKKEAEYAATLDLRVKAGELKEWRRQITFPLYGKNGGKICNTIIDFHEIYVDGREHFTEVKGYPSDTWPIKRKLWEDNYPHLKLVVVR